MRRFERIQRPWRSWDDRGLRRNLGVYVHLPFCLRRCRYCDFLSFGPAGTGLPALADYAGQLAQEIRRRGAWARECYAAGGRVVDSVFFGGGTPTYLPGSMLSELIRLVLAEFPLAGGGVEVSVEANPETLSAEYIAQLAAAGARRLSIGVQAVQDRHLRFLGRTHRFGRILTALAAAAAGPIPALSFDLIYGVPQLRPAELKRSLRLLLDFAPRHFSAYELTIEQGTPLGRWAARFPGRLASQAELVEQQRIVEHLLADHGFYRYEVSNYARPGSECRHNLRYWRGGDYIGLGLGAASRIGGRVHDNPRRYTDYCAAVAAAGSEADPLQALWRIARAEADREADAAAWLAPPADPFLKLRTRAGPAADSVRGALPHDWLLRRWLIQRGGRTELSSAGLNYADLLARDWPSDAVSGGS